MMDVMDVYTSVCSSELEQKQGHNFVRFRVLPPPPPSGRVAFYLFRNGEREQIKWYTQASEVEFELFQDGLYHAAAFIKYKEEQQPIIIHSRPIQVLHPAVPERIRNKTTISIFGSCVSRDLFELKQTDDFEIKCYIARQSIVSAVSSPITEPVRSILGSTAFDRRQVFNDIKKSTFSQLRDKTADYLLIDLVDERFPLVKYEGSLVTMSGGFQNSGLYVPSLPILKKQRLELENGGIEYNVDGKSLRDYVQSFCKEILSIFSQKQIILHRVRFTNYYQNREGQLCEFEPNVKSFNFSINQQLDYLYKCLQEFLPQSHMIDLSAGYYAVENHKWGLAAIHFQKEYYFAVLCALCDIVNLGYKAEH